MALRDDPILSEALRFWIRCRPVEGVPTRAEIDPLRIPRRLFPYLVLADVLDRSGRVRYRLLGEEMRERWGGSFAGRRSDEIFSGGYRRYMEGAFALVVEKRLPIYTASRFRWDVGGYLWTRRLMLPIAETPSGAVVQVMIVQTWPGIDETERRPEPPVVVPIDRPDDGHSAAVVIDDGE